MVLKYLFIFYLFAGLMLFSALMVIRVENPVHAVLYLVLVFLFNSCILLLIGAEFLSMLLLIVYVGAIAILFLFVVMMLPIKHSKNKTSKTFLQDVPIGVFIAVVLAFELIVMVNLEFISLDPTKAFITADYIHFDMGTFKLIRTPRDYPLMFKTDVSGYIFGKDSTKAFGIFLYSHNYSYVLIAGFVLLLAIVGAVMLARQDTKKVHKQEVYQQLSRRSENSVLKIRY